MEYLINCSLNSLHGEYRSEGESENEHEIVLEVLSSFDLIITTSTSDSECVRVRVYMSERVLMGAHAMQTSHTSIRESVCGHTRNTNIRENASTSKSTMQVSESAQQRHRDTHTGLLHVHLSYSVSSIGGATCASTPCSTAARSPGCLPTNT